jgi:hypothetical protein
MRRAFPFLSLVLAILAGGCAGPKFAAPKYHTNPSRFAALHLATPNKVYLSPVMDGLTENNRRLLNSKFSTSAYLTDALQQELTVAGLTPLPTPFAVGPNFSAAQRTISAQANQQEAAVYVISQVRWFDPVRITLDAKLLSPAGRILFEKRGLCVMLNAGANSQTVTQMALRQIIADPAFQQAVQ